MKAYVDFEITEGAYEISCPDAQCPAQGIMTLPEIANLTTTNLMKKHHRYRLNKGDLFVVIGGLNLKIPLPYIKKILKKY